MKLIHKIMLWGVAIAISVTVSSCTYLRPNAEKIQYKVDERVRELVSGSYAAAQIAKLEVQKAQAVMLTANVPTNGFDAVTLTQPNFQSATNSLDKADRALGITTDQARRTENLIGKPIVDQTPIIEALLSENKSIREAAERKEHSRELEEQKWRAKIETLERKLIEYGTKYEEERNERITSWIKWGSIALLAIGIPTALCVLFPPLLGVITSVFPALTSVFGTSGKLVKNTVKGIGNVRWQLKASQQTAKELGVGEKMYTAAEVLQLLDSNLKESLDDSDKKIINHYRQNLDV